MGDRARILVHSPGDPPVATIYIHWGGAHLEELSARLRGLEHSTAYATARAVQRIGEWLDDPFQSNHSLGLEPPVPVEDAETLAFGTDHGVLVWDWQANAGFVLAGDVKAVQ